MTKGVKYQGQGSRADPVGVGIVEWRGRASPDLSSTLRSGISRTECVESQVEKPPPAK